MLGIFVEETLVADDLRKTGHRDDTRINIDQDYEVRYWSEKLNLSPDRLKSAVAKAGPMVKNVRGHCSFAIEVGVMH